MMNTYKTQNSVSNSGWQNPYIYNARYAILIAGGGTLPKSSQTDGNMPAFWNDISELYNMLVSTYNYNSENVYLMYSYWEVTYTIPFTDQTYTVVEDFSNGDSRVDGEAAWDLPDKFDIRDAIEEIGGKTTKNDFLFFGEACHGYETDAIMVSNGEGYGAYLSYPNTLGPFINQNFGGKDNEKQYDRMCIVLQSCWSGQGINDLAGEDRIVMSATNRGELSWTELTIKDVWGNVISKSDVSEHFAFLHEGLHFWTEWGGLVRHFDYYPGFTPSLWAHWDYSSFPWTWVDKPNSIGYAFDCGYYAARNNYGGGLATRSYPQLDDDGNGLSAQDSDNDDGTLAGVTYL